MSAATTSAFKLEHFLFSFEFPSTKFTKTYRCLGVFDIVELLGVPTELRNPCKAKHLFSFPDNYLGTNVQHASHSVTLKKTRMDVFN